VRASPRFAFDPVEQYLRATTDPEPIETPPQPGQDNRWSRHGGVRSYRLDTLTARQIAARFGVSRDMVHQWRHRGLTVWSADRIAITLDRHPLEFWPDFYDDLLDEECA